MPGKASIKPDTLTYQAGDQPRNTDQRLIFQGYTFPKLTKLHIASIKIAFPNFFSFLAFAFPSALPILDQLF
jgi:hypothetical protein